MSIQSYKLGPGTLKFNVSRTVALVTTTISSATITTTTPAFLSGDVGQPITGAGIPASTTILAVISPTTATLSANATATGTVTVTITPAVVTDASCQVRACRVDIAENVTSTEAEDMLCGEQLPAEDTVTGYACSMTATLKQDLSTAGVIAWTWTNRGKVVQAEFIPSTALGKKVTGPVRVVPLSVGGDVNSRPNHDFTWVMPTVFPVIS